MECGIIGSKSISEAMGYLQTRRRYVSCKPGRKLQLRCRMDKLQPSFQHKMPHDGQGPS